MKGLRAKNYKDEGAYVRANASSLSKESSFEFKGKRTSDDSKRENSQLSGSGKSAKFSILDDQASMFEGGKI